MEDLIRREDAIQAISKDIMGGLNYEGILKRLPSVKPICGSCQILEKHHECMTRAFENGRKSVEPKRGHWIEIGKYKIKCSECKRVMMWRGHGVLIRPRFCPSCGSDMRGEKQ